jgi:Family of unknown function (DUF5706)
MICGTDGPRMTNEQFQAFERLLTSSFQRSIDFVKFAETKNAALLTFSSAWILALVMLLNKEPPISPAFFQVVVFAVPTFALAALLCMVSFLPRDNLDRFFKAKDGAKSLLFFRDVAALDIGAFRERIQSRYLVEGERYLSDHYLDDLAVQIAVNSKIATWKFRCFNFAAYLVFASLAILAIPGMKFIYSNIVHAIT